jgi:hypothetical protein
MFRTFGQSNWCMRVLDQGGVLRMDGCEVIWIGLYWKVMGRRGMKGYNRKVV